MGIRENGKSEKSFQENWIREMILETGGYLSGLFPVNFGPIPVTSGHFPCVYFGMYSRQGLAITISAIICRDDQMSRQSIVSARSNVAAIKSRVTLFIYY